MKKLIISDENVAVVVDMTEQEILEITNQIIERIIPPITRRQLRLWLLSNGIYDTDVRAAIDSIEDQTSKAIALIEWEDSSVYERNHPLISEIGLSMGFTKEQMDEGFITASNL